MSDFTSKTSSSSVPLSTAQAASSHEALGLLPDWACFYEPALSHAQVKHIESQMKSHQDYRNMPPTERQRAVVDDLQKALSSMRQVYSRSTDVTSDNTGNTPSAARTEAIARQMMTGSSNRSALGATAEDAIPIGLSDDDANTVDSVPTNSLTRLTDGHVHGKTAVNGDDIRPKRRKLSTDIASEVGGEARAPVASPPPERFDEDIPDIHSTAVNGALGPTWSAKDTARLLKAHKDGKTWVEIHKVRSR